MAGCVPRPEVHDISTLDNELAQAVRDSLSAPTADEMSLLELADRLLNRGVVLTGEATISVAGVDLIYLGLNVVLTSVENLHVRKSSPLARGEASATPPGEDAGAVPPQEDTEAGPPRGDASS